MRSCIKRATLSTIALAHFQFGSRTSLIVAFSHERPRRQSPSWQPVGQAKHHRRATRESPETNREANGSIGSNKDAFPFLIIFIIQPTFFHFLLSQKRFHVNGSIHARRIRFLTKGRRNGGEQRDPDLSEEEWSSFGRKTEKK